MNVLILTPDAVGSTLLQRVITVFMQLQDYGRPVINLHELVNGLNKFYSPDFNQEIVGKHQATWGYHQSLTEIVDMLNSVDHFKTSRLAHYHLRNRNDDVGDLIPFYQYLNENFFIIAARRENVFEHAMSWALNRITKKKNVYSGQEKISAFYEIYRDGVDVDPEVMVKILEDYRLYLEWSERHFGISSYFHYERHMPDIEKYALNLPIFAGQKKIQTFKDTYGISFSNWNRCNYYTSNIGALALGNDNGLLKLGSTNIDKDLPETAPSNVVAHLPVEQRSFVRTHIKNYVAATHSIEKMVELGILTSGVPIKKQTLAEKRFMIRNFDQCREIYNQWIAENPTVGKPVTELGVQAQIESEQQVWNPQLITNSTESSEPLPIQQISH